MTTNSDPSWVNGPSITCGLARKGGSLAPV